MAVHFAAQRSNRPDLNIAPLIDVVFLLLVFFLLTSSAGFTELDLDSPVERADAPMAGDLLASTVRISEGGAVVLDDVPLSVEVLGRAVAKQLGAGGSQRPFVVRPEGRVPVSLIVRVVDELKAGGASNVQIGELAAASEIPR